MIIVIAHTLQISPRRVHEDVAYMQTYIYFLSSHTYFYFPASGQQAVITGVVLSPPRFLPSIFIAHRVQQSHCSSIFHRVLLTHAPTLSASQFVHKKKSQRIYTRMHSAGIELTKLTYTRLKDNLIRHRGNRSIYWNLLCDHEIDCGDESTWEQQPRS